MPALLLLVLSSLLHHSRGQFFNISESSLKVYRGHSHNVLGDSFLLYSPNQTQPRSKRSVVELYNMIKCATPCNPLAYKGYGCYCGFLGSGYPIDGIDRCCQLHDRCYDRSGCLGVLQYFIPYDWACFGGRPYCDISRRNSCGGRLCQCDRAFAMCLSRHWCPRRMGNCRSSPSRLFQNLVMSVVLDR